MVEAGFLSADHYPTESLSSVRGLESEEQMLRLNNQQDCFIQAGTKGQHAKGTAWKAPILIPVHISWTRRRLKDVKVTQKRRLQLCWKQQSGRTFKSNNTTTHLSNECKVLKALAESMPRQATAVFDRNKRKNEQPKENSGDIHVPMAHAVSVSIKLAKANKKQTPKTHQTRNRNNSDSEEESSKNFDPGFEKTLTLKKRLVKISSPNSFHLNLEQRRLTP